MSDIPQLTLKPHKSGTFATGHPWVLAKSLDPLAQPVEDGAVVDLLSADGHFVARGIYNGRSHIRVRLYCWQPGQALDEAFWLRRLESAWTLRRQLGYDDPQGAARLVFSESDGLSGLIVDRYADHLVVQPTALAMALRLPQIVPWLTQLAASQATPLRGISVRTDRKIAEAEGMEPSDYLAWGQPPLCPTTYCEHTIAYQIDLAEGQKTGSYLDQRENRRATAAFCPGRRVLDVCCYSGGFALAAAKLGRAREVLAVDSSARALQQAQANARLNALENVRFQQGDCFDALAALRSARERFDVVVLDPPRFAGSRRSIDAALAAYHRLNRLAVDLLASGGILVTCSCSGRVSRDDFRRMLSGVAQKTRRQLQILQQRGAAPDHPVSLSCPETEYLKCFICRAE